MFNIGKTSFHKPPGYIYKNNDVENNIDKNSFKKDEMVTYSQVGNNIEQEKNNEIDLDILISEKIEQYMNKRDEKKLEEIKKKEEEEKKLKEEEEKKLKEEEDKKMKL